jgi:TRAP-type C4-dicarboxylate transport system permease small subunit
MKLFSKILIFIDRCGEIFFEVGSLIYLSMILVLSLDVSLRFILNRPTLWATDVARYSLLWGTLLGAAYLVKNDQHINVDLLIRHLGPRARWVLNIFSSVVCTLMSLIIFIYSLNLTWSTFIRGIRVADPIEIPKFIPLMGIPLGSFFLTLAFGVKVWRIFSVPNEELKKEQN